MITHPTRQSELRTPRRSTLLGHQHAALALRLTARDRWILHMLHEHRVLTIDQICDLAFPTAKIARRRLLQLHRYGVVDRFRPLRRNGSAPTHWVLAPAGAAVLAAEIGVDVLDLGYRYEHALAVANSLHLAHTVGVNEWFTSLIAATAHPSGSDPGTVLAWWSETRCRQLWGDLARPDAYGRFKRHGATVDFLLEYDLGTMSLGTVAAKLRAYADLARATAVITPVLLWLPTARRETTARRALHTVWTTLPDPGAVPVATAAADLLDPTATNPSPADRVWLPLEGTSRVALHRLAAAWPRLTKPLPATSTTTGTIAATGRHAVLAPPAPTPPPAGEQ